MLMSALGLKTTEMPLFEGTKQVRDLTRNSLRAELTETIDGKIRTEKFSSGD